MPSQRHTSPKAATASSKALKSPQSGRNAKIAAASALSQAAPKRSTKKR